MISNASKSLFRRSSQCSFFSLSPAPFHSNVLIECNSLVCVCVVAVFFSWLMSYTKSTLQILLKACTYKNETNFLIHTDTTTQIHTFDEDKYNWIFCARSLFSLSLARFAFICVFDVPFSCALTLSLSHSLSACPLLLLLIKLNENV